MNTKQIKHDFATFADPASLVEIDGRIIAWKQGRQERTALLSQDGARISYGNKEYGYAQFFASEHMADFRRLAESLPHYIRSLPGYVEHPYIESSLHLEDGVSLQQKQLGASLLRDLCERQAPSPRTKLVLLRGRAGDGKTALLSRAALEQATLYADGASTWLYLYVDAQGRALSRVDEAIALILHDLRAVFTYHAVHTLARLGLLVPIIDGFDELLGAGGYRDAFSSLWSVLARLKGQGTILASGRSSFYEYTSFDESAYRAAEISPELSYGILPVDLLPWTDKEAAAFIDLSGKLPKRTGADVVNTIKAKLPISADELISSPFLLSQTVALLAKTEFQDLEDKAKSLVRLAVEDFVRRELTEKVLDSHGAPALTSAQHMSIIGELAEEMWWQETMILDIDSYHTLVEIACENFDTSSISAALIDKLSSHALLSVSSNPRGISFRHELYHAHFMGSVFEDAATDPQAMQALCTRSTVPRPIADEFACAMEMKKIDHAHEALATLAAMKPRAVQRDLLRANLGTIYAAFIREFGLKLFDGENLGNAVFEDEDLVETKIKNCVVSTCDFVVCDFSKAHWEQITFRRCRLILPKFDTKTRLECSGLVLPEDLNGIEMHGGSEAGKIFEPHRILRVARQVGMDIPPPPIPKPTAASEAMRKELAEFLQIVRNTLVFSEQDFQRRNKSINNFEEAISLLRRHGLLKHTKTQSSGTRQLHRLTVPSEMIRMGESGTSNNDSVRELWAEISHL